MIRKLLGINVTSTLHCTAASRIIIASLVVKTGSAETKTKAKTSSVKTKTK